MTPMQSPMQLDSSYHRRMRTIARRMDDKSQVALCFQWAPGESCLESELNLDWHAIENELKNQLELNGDILGGFECVYLDYGDTAAIIYCFMRAGSKYAYSIHLDAKGNILYADFFSVLAIEKRRYDVTVISNSERKWLLVQEAHFRTSFWESVINLISGSPEWGGEVRCDDSKLMATIDKLFDVRVNRVTI